MKKPVSKKEVKENMASEVIIDQNQSVKPTYTLTKPVKYAIGTLLALIALIAFGVYKFGIIAMVNNKPISRLDYIQQMEGQIGKQTLENMITEVLIFEAAQKNNVTITQEVIDGRLNELDTQFKAQGTSLDQMLAQENMSRSELERQIRLQQLVETMGQGNTEVTDAEVNNYISENKDQLPKDKKPDELKTMVKEQLISQAKSQNIQEWISNLRASAVINYH